MLPSRFPDEDQAPERSEYNTVDATLRSTLDRREGVWYFEAIRAYHEATHDEALVRDLFPVLPCPARQGRQDIVDWHVRGMRYQIHVDPADGLLYAGGPGVQLSTPLRSGTPYRRLDGCYRSAFGRRYSARWTTGW